MIEDMSEDELEVLRTKVKHIFWDDALRKFEAQEQERKAS